VLQKVSISANLYFTLKIKLILTITCSKEYPFLKFHINSQVTSSADRQTDRQGDIDIASLMLRMIHKLIFTSHGVNHASCIANQNNMIIRGAWLATKSQACYKQTFAADKCHTINPLSLLTVM